MEAFKVLQAPFDGTVTARNIDIGALINAGSSTPLFTVSQVTPLRVYVNVPESLAAAVKAGVRANLRFDSFPGTRSPLKSLRLRAPSTQRRALSHAIGDSQYGWKTLSRSIHDDSF